MITCSICCHGCFTDSMMLSHWPFTIVIRAPAFVFISKFCNALCAELEITPPAPSFTVISLTAYPLVSHFHTGHPSLPFWTCTVPQFLTSTELLVHSVWVDGKYTICPMSAIFLDLQIASWYWPWPFNDVKLTRNENLAAPWQHTHKFFTPDSDFFLTKHKMSQVCQALYLYSVNMVPCSFCLFPSWKCHWQGPDWITRKH